MMKKLKTLAGFVVLLSAIVMVITLLLSVFSSTQANNTKGLYYGTLVYAALFYAFLAFIILRNTFKEPKDKADLVKTTNSGMFKIFPSGVIHYRPGGIWAKKHYILRSKKDRQKILTIYYSYNLAVIGSILLLFWNENIVLLIILNIALYILQSQLIKRITMKLKQESITKTFLEKVQSHANEMSYFHIFTVLPVILYLAWQTLTDTTVQEEEMLFDLVSAVFLSFFIGFLFMILYYKIKESINNGKSSNSNNS